MTGTPVPVAPAAGTDRWGDVAAAAVLVAGAGHALAALDHLHHDLRFAVFFLLAGAVQLGVGPLLRRAPRPALVGAVLTGTAGLLLLYLLSRTVPLALGPHSDRPADPGLLGTVVVLAEVVAIGTLPALLAPRARRVAVNAVLAVGVAVWVSWIAGFLG